MYIPTHKSHVDYLLLSYVLFARDMVVPCIAAGDNLAKLLGIAWVFRMCGAFYIRRTFGSDVLYKEVRPDLGSYVSRDLSCNAT